MKAKLFLATARTSSILHTMRVVSAMNAVAAELTRGLALPGRSTPGVRPGQQAWAMDGSCTLDRWFAGKAGAVGQRTVLACAFVAWAGQGVAQQDTVAAAVPAEPDMAAIIEQKKAAFMADRAWKNPSLRQAGISTDVYASGNIRSDLYGKSFFEGRIQTVRTNTYVNVPLLHIGKNRLFAGAAVCHQTIQLTEVVSRDDALPVQDRVIHNTLLNPTLNYTRLDSLFARPVIYSATASAVIDPNSGQARYAGTGMVMVTVRRTKKATLSVGLIGLFDPAAPVPVIPMVSYLHRFKPGVELNLSPMGLALRKELDPINSLTLSSTIGSNLALFRRDVVNLPIEKVYTTFEMRSGLTYEHLFNRKVVATVSAGASAMFTSKVFTGNASRDPFIKNAQSATPYVRLGVSFLPFWKGFAK